MKRRFALSRRRFILLKGRFGRVKRRFFSSISKSRFFSCKSDKSNIDFGLLFSEFYIARGQKNGVFFVGCKIIINFANQLAHNSILTRDNLFTIF